MENTYKRLIDWLDSLYIPKSKKELLKQLKERLTGHDVRSPDKRDQFKSGVEMLFIHTRGKGRLESFDGFKFLYADFDAIGNKYALVYVYDSTGGKPLRMDITSIKNLVII